MASPCIVTYKQKEMPFADYLDMMASGEYDALVKNGTLSIESKPTQEAEKPSEKGEIKQSQLQSTMEKEGFINESEIRAEYKTKGVEQAALEGLELLREKGEQDVENVIASGGVGKSILEFQPYSFAGAILIRAYNEKIEALRQGGDENAAMDLEKKAVKLGVQLSVLNSQMGQTTALTGLALAEFKNAAMVIEAIVNSNLKDLKTQIALTEATHVGKTDADEVNNIINEALENSAEVQALKKQVKALAEQNENLKEQVEAIANGKTAPTSKGNATISKRRQQARQQIKEGLDEMFGALASMTGGKLSAVKDNDSFVKGAKKAINGLMKESGITFEEAFEKLKQIIKDKGFDTDKIDEVKKDLLSSLTPQKQTKAEKDAEKALVIIKAIEKSNKKKEEKLSDNYEKPDKAPTRDEQLKDIFLNNPDIAEKLINRYEESRNRAIKVNAAKKLLDFYNKKRKEKDSNATVTPKQKKDIVNGILDAYKEAELASEVIGEKALKEAYVVAKNGIEGIADLEGLREELNAIKKKMSGVPKNSVAHAIYFEQALNAISSRIPLGWLSYYLGKNKSGMLSGLPTFLAIAQESVVGRITAITSLAFNPRLLIEAYRKNGLKTNGNESLVTLPNQGAINVKLLWKYGVNMANQGTAQVDAKAGKQTLSQKSRERWQPTADYLKSKLPFLSKAIDAVQALSLYDSVFKAIATPEVFFAPATNFYHVVGQVYQQERINENQRAKDTDTKYSEKNVIKNTFDKIAIADAKAHTAAFEKAQDMYKGTQTEPLIIQAEAYKLLEEGFEGLDGITYEGTKKESDNANYINRTQNLAELRNVQNSATGEIDESKSVVGVALGWLDEQLAKIPKNAEQNAKEGKRVLAAFQAGVAMAKDLVAPFLKPLIGGISNTITATPVISNIQQARYAYKRSASGEKGKNAALASLYINPFSNDATKQREYQEYNNMRANAMQGVALMALSTMAVMLGTPDDDDFDKDGKYVGKGGHILNTGALQGMPESMQKNISRIYGKGKIIYIDDKGVPHNILGTQNMMASVSINLPFILSNFYKYESGKYVKKYGEMTQAEKQIQDKVTQERLYPYMRVWNGLSTVSGAMASEIAGRSWNYGLGVVLDFAGSRDSKKSWEKEKANDALVRLVAQQPTNQFFKSFFSSVDDLTNSEDLAFAWDNSPIKKTLKGVLYGLPFSKYYGARPAFNMFGNKIITTVGSNRNVVSAEIENLKRQGLSEEESKNISLFLDKMSEMGTFPESTWLRSDMCYIDKEGVKPLTEGMKYDAEYYAAKLFYNTLKGMKDDLVKYKLPSDKQMEEYHKELPNKKPKNIEKFAEKVLGSDLKEFDDKISDAMKYSLKVGKEYSLYKHGVKDWETSWRDIRRDKYFKDEAVLTKQLDEINKKGLEDDIPLGE